VVDEEDRAVRGRQPCGVEEVLDGEARPVRDLDRTREEDAVGRARARDSNELRKVADPLARIPREDP
jgi:hypothetical protein